MGDANCKTVVIKLLALWLYISVDSCAYCDVHCHVLQALAPHFGGIMAFVRDVEVQVEGGHMDRIKVQPGEAQQHTGTARWGLCLCVPGI